MIALLDKGGLVRPKNLSASIAAQRRLQEPSQNYSICKKYQLRLRCVVYINVLSLVGLSLKQG